VADAGSWSDANAATETDGCELFIATQKDHAQRAALRDAPPPRGRKPKTMTARERMQRKLRTKRGLDRCRGEWLLDAAVHNLRKLHRDSVRRTEKARQRAAKRIQRAA
jgi:hypothetical protein